MVAVTVTNGSRTLKHRDQRSAEALLSSVEKVFGEGVLTDPEGYVLTTDQANLLAGEYVWSKRTVPAAAPAPKVMNVSVIVPCTFKDSPDRMKCSGTKEGICKVLQAAGIIGLIDTSTLDPSQYPGLHDPALEIIPLADVDFQDNQLFLGYRPGNQPEVEAWIESMVRGFESQAAEMALGVMRTVDPSASRVCRREFQSTVCSPSPTNSSVPLIKFELDGLVVGRNVAMVVEAKTCFTMEVITQVQKKLKKIGQLIALDPAEAGPDAELFRGKEIHVALAGRHVPNEQIKEQLRRLIKEEEWAVWLPDGSGLDFGDSRFKVPDATKLHGSSFASGGGGSSSSAGKHSSSSSGTLGGVTYRTSPSSGGGGSTRHFSSCPHPSQVSAVLATPALHERPAAALQRLPLPPFLRGCMCTILAALKRL